MASFLFLLVQAYAFNRSLRSASEAVAEGEVGTEVLAGCIGEAFLVEEVLHFLGIDVGESPVEAQDEVVVLGIFGTEAEAQTAVETLVGTHPVLLLEDGLRDVTAEVVHLGAELAVRTHGKVGAEVGYTPSMSSTS